MTPDAVTIRPATSAADYLALQAAQRRAWGITSDGYIVPVATMVGAQLHGGLVLGAFLPSGEAVGLSFAFLGRHEGQLCIYSQLTGVVPEHQGHGLGLRLKQAQLAFARAQGLSLLAWAFDPLQAGNAHFNLDRLGATSRRYVENMYGVRTDAVNRGATTDRLIVEWATMPRPPIRLDPDALTHAFRPITRDAGQLRLDMAGMDQAAHGVWLLEIPEGMASLRDTQPDTAAAWQQAVRAAFQAAFARDLIASGFHRDEHSGERRCFYVLTPTPPRDIAS